MINLGKPLKNLGTATLNIQWPKEVSNGKWLLYLVKVESKGLEKIACQPQNEINFLKLKVGWWILHLNYFCAFGDGRRVKINCQSCEFGTVWGGRAQEVCTLVPKNYLRWNYFWM